MPENSVAGTGTEPKPLELVLMGTGPFAVPSFEALRSDGHNILLVVTRPQRLGPGRKSPPPSPVRQWASDWQLPLSAPESINSAEAIAELQSLQPDLLVVCDYGQILKPAALQTARLGGINLHGSLLPAYRGAAPVQWSVLNGDAETGVSVIHMTPRLDAGPVISSQRTPIGAKETAGELEARLAQLGVEATRSAVEILSKTEDAAETLLGEPQDAARACRAPRLAKDDGLIDWSRSASQLNAHVRGMQPWPTAFTTLPVADKPNAEPLRLVILELETSEEAVPGGTPPGTIRQQGKEIWVATGDFWVQINRLKPAGKREMTAEQWLCGRPFAATADPRLGIP